MHSYGTSDFVTTDDGRRLHYMARGEGGPTVVFVSGMGFSRSTWGLVHPIVAQRVRAVVYDRAGTGRSDDDARPRTLDRLAGDLATLLRALGSGPFVLVGHSWGGPIARVAAALDPERIHGLVLVDQSDENCAEYFGAAARRRDAMARLLMPALARTGLYRRLASGLGGGQPADIAADHRAEDFTVRAAKTLLAEQDGFGDGLRELRDRPLELDGLPLSVISGTRIPRLDGGKRQALIAAHCHTATAGRGRWVAAERSGHLVMFSEPELVVAEILCMIA